ncbi:MAG: MgtC/SapB family protein, partial [Polymorphobacter sp.]
AAAVVTLLLAQRRLLHDMLRGMTEADIKAVARFAIIAGVVWPLLPDRAMGPYAAWNPRDLWLVVVVVCGLSFAGYAAGRRFGTTRGTLATAAIGALYSSTAVTAALAQRLRSEPEQAGVLRAGIAVASAVLFARVLVLTALLVPFALPRLAAIVGPAAAVALGFAALSWRAASAAPAIAAVGAGGRNPFALLPALGFAVLVAVLALVVRWAEVRFGDAGIAVVLAITGSMDVDAAIVTMRGLPPGRLDAQVAGLILALPVLLNTLFKAVIVLLTAGWAAGWRAAMPLLAAAAVLPVMALVTR